MVVKVGVRDLRENLKSWLDRVKAGDDVVVTERGKPIVRISAVDRRSRLEELIEAGIVQPARRPRRPIDPERLLPPLTGDKTLADIVIEQRSGSES